MEKNKTYLELGENIEGVLCYVLGWVTGIIFLIIEKENLFVRFHAMQSLIVFLSLFVLNIITISILSPIIFLIALVLWALFMFKAYQGERYKIPWIGEFIEKRIFKEHKGE